MEYSIRILIIMVLLVIGFVIFVALATNWAGTSVDLIGGIRQFLESLFS